MRYYWNKVYEFLKIIGATLSLYIIQSLPLAFAMTGNATIATLLSFIVLVFMLIVYKKKDYSIKNLNKDVFAYAFIFVIFAMSSLSLISFVFNLSESTANQKTIESLFQISHIPVFITGVFIAPLIEEYIFRELFFVFILGSNYDKTQKLWMKSRKIWTAIVLTSAGFAFMHEMTSITSFLIYMSLGLGLGFIRAKSNKLEYSVIAHMVWNAFVFIVMTLS